MLQVAIDEVRCKGCALCTPVCPRGLLRLSERTNRFGLATAELIPGREAECSSCALCAQVCPDVAISVYRAEHVGEVDE